VPAQFAGQTRRRLSQQSQVSLSSINRQGVSSRNLWEVSVHRQWQETSVDLVAFAVELGVLDFCKIDNSSNELQLNSK